MAFTRILKIGDKGNDVRLVQQALGITVDGDFGRATKAAVEEFQRNKGLTVDGIVGSATWEALGLNSTISLTPKTPQLINQTRLEERIIRQQAQENTKIQQIDPNLIGENTPEEFKPKGKAKFGKRIFNIGKKILQIITPALSTLAAKYALSEFQKAKEETSPEQIEDLKAKYCPTKEELDRLITIRNNIVSQLNNLGKPLPSLNSSVGGISTIISSLKGVLLTTEVTQTATSIASKVIPSPPGVPGIVPSLLNDLQTIKEKLIPKVELNSAFLNSTTVPLAVVSSIVLKIKTVLSSLDALILLCNPNAQLDDISAELQVIADREEEADVSDGSYKGFIFQIEEVPYSPTVTRRRAIALNQGNIPLLQTELSFTTSEQTLINELKFIIDRDNLKPY